LKLDLLVLAAHPDDAELSCGGWLALAAARGQATGVVDLTAGELATNGTPQLRAAEAAEAARILGLAVRENLGLPDCGVADQVAPIVEVIRRLQPALLVAPWVEDRHPDHAATGQLARRAGFLAGLVRFRPELGAPWRPSRVIHYAQAHDVRPDFVVDITAAIDAKRRSVRAHHSQVGPGTPTRVNSTDWEVRDRYWGAAIGAAFGEPYVLGGPVPLADPVAHL
jgi:N-acetylglucosamine malate deacetylase 1